MGELSQRVSDQGAKLAEVQERLSPLVLLQSGVSPPVDECSLPMLLHEIRALAYSINSSIHSVVPQLLEATKSGKCDAEFALAVQELSASVQTLPTFIGEGSDPALDCAH